MGACGLAEVELKAVEDRLEHLAHARDAMAGLVEERRCLRVHEVRLTFPVGDGCL